MARSRKRKHEESDAIKVIIDLPPQEEYKKLKKEHREKKIKTLPHTIPPASTTSSKPDSVSQSFAAFKCALSDLLSRTAASDIHAVLGDDEPANFVVALQTMKSTGDLAWLNADHASDSECVEDGEVSGDSTTKGSLDNPLPIAPPLSLGRPASLPAIASQSWPPPLPVVHNEALRQQAFTHKSFIKGEEVGLPGTEQRHYERLEFLGDSYLQSIASHLLYNRFPTQREGTLSDMRQQLVANKPLSTYATMYKFHTMVREGKGQENLTPVPLGPRLPGLPRNSQRGVGNRALTAAGGAGAKVDLNKTLADCFEAYIAAIILDDPVNGVMTVTEWLKVLYEPKLREMEMQHSSVAPIDKMAKQTLNTIAGGNKVNIEYKWTDGKGGNKGGFWITVLLTGWGWEEREIGRGWGSNKGDAALRAAMNVIANKEFVEEMAATRLKWLGPKPNMVANTPAILADPVVATDSPALRPIAENGDILNYDD